MMPMVNWVALLAEGVDRNHNLLDALTELFQVALLAEGVDRNSQSLTQWKQCSRSPSSRRAWIEIFHWNIVSHQPDVALLAEGVDRNNFQQGIQVGDICRPPRGGRG